MQPNVLNSGHFSAGWKLSCPLRLQLCNQTKQVYNANHRRVLVPLWFFTGSPNVTGIWCVHTWIYIWIHTRTHMYVYIYGQVADVCAHITHIQLATTQLWDAWSHPHSEKDLLLLQAQLVVLVSLLSLTHFQQSRACQKHKKPDWVSVKSRQN